MVVGKIPSPNKAAPLRVGRLWPWSTEEYVSDMGGSSEDVVALEGVRDCLAQGAATAEAPVLAFVSKMFAKDEPVVGSTTWEIKQQFYGFARV